MVESEQTEKETNEPADLFGPLVAELERREAAKRASLLDQQAVPDQEPTTILDSAATSDVINDEQADSGAGSVPVVPVVVPMVSLDKAEKPGKEDNSVKLGEPVKNVDDLITLEDNPDPPTPYVLEGNFGKIQPGSRFTIRIEGGEQVYDVHLVNRNGDALTITYQLDGGEETPDTRNLVEWEDALTELHGAGMLEIINPDDDEHQKSVEEMNEEELVAEWKRMNESFGDADNKALSRSREFYDYLVEQFVVKRPPDEAISDWEDTWWLKKFDLGMYGELNFGELENGDRLETIISRVREMRLNWVTENGLFRIAIIPGVSRLQARYLELDTDNPYVETDDPAKDGTICRIVPGKGGYELVEDPKLRPTALEQARAGKPIDVSSHLIVEAYVQVYQYKKPEGNDDIDSAEIQIISEALDSVIANTPGMYAMERKKIIEEQIVPNGKKAVVAIFANPMLESFLRLKEPEGRDMYREALMGGKLIPKYAITTVLSEIFKKIITNEQGLQAYIQEQLRVYLKDDHDSSAAKELLIDLGSEDKELMQSALNDTDPDCAACAIRALKQGESSDVIGAMERFASSDHPYALSLFSNAYRYFIKDFENLNEETLNQIFLLSVQYFSNCRHNLLSVGTSTKNMADDVLKNLANLAKLAGKTIGSDTIKRLIDIPSGDPIASLRQDLGLS